MKSNTKENKIKELAMELIPKKLRINLLHLLSDICVNLKEPTNCDGIDEVLDVMKEIESLTCEINDFLIIPIDKRDDFTHRIETVRKNIMEYVKSVYVNGRFITMISKFLLDQKCVREIKKDNILNKTDNIDFLKIFDDCINFIYEVDSEYENAIDFISAKRRCDILSCLPLRMTKAKYNDYIREFFKYLSIDSPKSSLVNFLGLYKDLFVPFKSDYFGKYFNHISEGLVKLWNLDFDSISDEEIEKAISDLEELGKNNVDISKFLFMLYNDINYIVNLLLFCIDDEYLFDDDIMFKDIYFTTKNIIKSESDRVFIDDILSRIYDEIEITENDIKAMDKNFDDILDMIDVEKVSESVYTYIMIKLEIDKNFYDEAFMVLENYSYTQEEEADNLNDKIDEELFDEKVNEFFDYIKNALSEIPNKKAKYIKTYFFEYISYFGDEEEYDKYIEFVINNLKTVDNFYLYLVKLSNLIEKENFDDEDNVFDEDFFHHHEHCECGHKH